MPGAILRPHSILTYSPRARPVSARLVFESSRWLRHQHTEESGFLGPSMVATSSNRAFVAGRTTVPIVPGYARPHPREARPSGGEVVASLLAAAAQHPEERGAIRERQRRL